MSFTEKSLISEILFNPSIQNRQSAYNVITDMYRGLRAYLQDTFTAGIGVLIPGFGAFYLENNYDSKQDHSYRQPRFLFMGAFLDRMGVRAGARQTPAAVPSNLGTLFETNGPLHRLNWTSVAKRCGLTPNDCKEAWDILFSQLQSAVLGGQDGTFDFGIGVFRVSDRMCSVKIAAAAVQTLTQTGKLSTVGTNQAMTSLGTFYPTEDCPRGTVVVHR